MSITILNEHMPVTTPLGDGYAILIEATAHDYYWTVALESGALVSFTQDKIRIANSYTYHRGISDERMREIVNGKH